MKTFWALTVIPKAQQKGDQKDRFTKAEEKAAAKQGLTPNMAKPLYETEAEVTRAIASGTKQTDPTYPTRDPYELARAWQKELKRCAPKSFKPQGKMANRNGQHNFTMQFGS